MAVFAGKVLVSVNGVKQRVMASVKMTMGGDERTMLEGNEVHGAVSKVVHGEITFGIIMHTDTDLTLLQTVEEQTVLIEFDNGRSYVMTQAFTLATNEVEVGGGENEATIVLGGQPIQEL